MPRDRSLDEFAVDEPGDDIAVDEPSGDERDDVDEADAGEEVDEADAGEKVDEADAIDADPATPTATWTTDGAVCERCDDRVTRRWFDDGDVVCIDCKEW